ncbi:little elongation complex subunit 1 isoform X4 [Choloepus didactylus]|uniref:little elongation complex subunit 1 isoform X4 n=1 Tax=Choloepus didactylus TaxID=27675 RepID=UPI00189D8F08|nr:little elongation complex subunit 1 isoform X4 [Choloepus didactylus]
MMPGETRSAAPGTAAELARCQGCASLQQNLNEYVDALITLKQKIINTDNLLTEYQKKCDELQFARRENSTLHHQVEQMLQKISPLQKCQEELGSLKAELEEKKSSLKLYQDTHQEICSCKEKNALKSDAQKKKLEAKVKKLEEAAVKQIQDFKQLRNEKKVLEKEFKKTQERLDEFSKQKDEKELRHIGTQISSDSYGSIDKRKVKLLLKELWLCINTTHRLPGEGSKCIQDISTEKSAKENTQSRESMEDCVLPPKQCSPLRTSEVQTCLAKLSMEIDADCSSCRDVEKERPSVASHSKDHMFNERKNPEVFMQGNTGDDSTDFSEHKNFLDDDLQAAIDFFKLPPPLLSPVPSPPLMSLPHLSPLRSSLTPETFFGEYTDSSDDDSAQHKTSAESILEDDIMEPPNYFGLSRSNERGTLDEQPKPPEATHVTTAAFETSTATWRKPSTTYSLASEQHLAASSEFISDKPRDIFNDAKRQIEVREMDKSLQTEKAVPKPSRTRCLEMLSGDLAHEKDAAVRKSGLCYSPLSKRPLSELVESEEESLLSKMIESPKSELTKRTLRNETTSESECRQTVSDCFQGVSGEMEKERGDMQRFFLGESPEPEEESASDVADAAGLTAEARSSSASSVAFSGCRNRQSAAWWECDSDTRLTTKAALTELSPSGKHLQIKTLNTLESQSEPPECSRGQNSLEPGLHALSPELVASNFNAQTSSEKECTKIVKGMTKVYSLPQSVFMKVTKDGQCESEDPKLELTLNKPDYTSVINSQGGLIKSAFGFVKSTSWHHSDLLRQDGDEHLRATSEHEQDTGLQCKKAATSLGNRGSASKLELPRENNSPLEFKAASLSNQVSVITKQVKPEKIQSGRSEHFKLHRSEPGSATENINGKGPLSSISTSAGEREDKTQKVKEVTTMKRAPLEVSTSWRKLDLASLSGSLPVGNSHCSTDSKLSFSSENTPVQKQGNVKGASVQEEPQKQSQFPSATAPGLFGVDVNKLLPAPEVPVSEGVPIGELPCGDNMGSGSEAPAISNDTPSVQQNSDEPLKLKSKTPGGACPQFFVTTGTAFSSVFSRKDEETHDVTQSKVPDTLYCYTDIREGQNNDTEGEETEPLSSSEGENENENIMGNEQQDVTNESLKDLGDSDAGVSETGPSIEHLAECLLHSILSELKIQKVSMDHSYIHALCRVYVGICRQLGDLERARLFCYSILKEDFPESEKLTLFIANMWHDIFISQSVINKAMQLVARQRAKGEVLNCLRAFLNWEKNAPVDVGFMVSKLLLTIQLCPKTEFQSSEKFGEDLSDNTWEYIFAIDLLCCHQKWIWTHDNIISKELWPVMDKWIKYRKGHADIACTPDIIIASTLRLIGRLGQLGLKEGFPSAVKNISSVIGMFIQHAQEEDIPWGIQLAAVYALCDLSPSNPTEISKILEAWRKETSNSVPSVIVSYLEEASSLGVEELS